ncbi:MAG: MTH1187 family thiamine-binding protein [Nitriliruptorales bacterium]|nr:MTH1187 family thiamine-binding protein [Nitriliruptorales bacterium]
MILAFSITPLGAGESVGEVVAGCVRLVRDSGLPNETNAMFTNIEGDWDEVMGVLKACVDHVAAVAPRVSVVCKIDHRPGHDGGLEAKVARVESLLDG